MDLKAYYRKIRQAENELPQGDQLMVSLPTPDGGKAGVVSEVPREIASRMIVESKARRATAEETKAYREQLEARLAEIEEAAAAKSIHLHLVRELETAISRGESKRKS